MRVIYLFIAVSLSPLVQHPLGVDSAEALFPGLSATRRRTTKAATMRPEAAQICLASALHRPPFRRVQGVPMAW